MNNREFKVIRNDNPRTLEMVQEEMLTLQEEYFSDTTPAERKAELETILRALEEEQDNLLFKELNTPSLYVEKNETPPTDE